MKFAKQLSTELTAFSPEWQTHVIPYKRLKKTLKRPDEGEISLDQVYDFLKHLCSEEFESMPFPAELLANPNHEFAPLLVSSLFSLNDFLHRAKVSIEESLMHIRSQLASVTNSDSVDLKQWRVFMEEYDQIHLSNQTQAPLKLISYTKLKPLLHKLIHQVKVDKIFTKFKDPKSKRVLFNILNVSQQILTLIHFNELNQLALKKILKKMAKTTQNLTPQQMSELVLKFNPLFEHSQILIKDWGTVILKCLPSTSDYECPVCYDIAWRPIRLKCGHLFCLLCCLQAQFRNMPDCPMCRTKNAMKEADSLNIDLKMQELMKEKFPLEIKKKGKHNMAERDRMYYQQVTGRKVNQSQNGCSIM
jgi:hypothetical protein